MREMLLEVKTECPYCNNSMLSEVMYDCTCKGCMDRMVSYAENFDKERKTGSKKNFESSRNRPENKKLEKRV